MYCVARGGGGVGAQAGPYSHRQACRQCYSRRCECCTCVVQHPAQGPHVSVCRLQTPGLIQNCYAAHGGADAGRGGPPCSRLPAYHQCDFLTAAHCDRALWTVRSLCVSYPRQSPSYGPRSQCAAASAPLGPVLFQHCDCAPSHP